MECSLSFGFWAVKARILHNLRFMFGMQALSSMLEALQHSLNEECEGRRVEVQARAEAQERCSAADECLSKLEWESNQASVSLQRKVRA